MREEAESEITGFTSQVFWRYISLIYTMTLLPGFNTLNDKPNRLVVVCRKPQVAGDVCSIHLVQQRSAIIPSRCLSNAISQASPSDELSHGHVAMWHCASGALRSVTCTWLRRFLARKLTGHYLGIPIVKKSDQDGHIIRKTSIEGPS